MINKEMIFVNKSFKSRKEVFNCITNKAKEINLISNESAFMEAVEERENMTSTAFDFNIAIPHGKASVVNEPFISYLSTEESFNWNDDGDAVNYIFLIGVPEKGGSHIHLKYISEVSKRLLDENFRESLFNSENVDEAFSILSSLNNKN